MKTLRSLTTALLMIVTFGAMANDSSNINSGTTAKRNIAAPAFVWGTPEDVNTKSVEHLKYLPLPAPAMVWGAAEDLNEAELEVLKVRTNVSLEQPAFNWGTPADLDVKSIEVLKTNAHTIRFPEMVIGNPADIDASDLK